MSENKRVDLEKALTDWVEFAKNGKMDGAMADMQADDMKHGLYDEPMDTGLREWLEDRIAARLLESADMDDLETVYYDTQHEWAESLPDDDLLQTARDLGIEDTVEEYREMEQKSIEAWGRKVAAQTIEEK